jgi:peptidoglycan/xylan/chitin deacetylase (PgdA/CDA1 family)
MACAAAAALLLVAGSAQAQDRSQPGTRWTVEQIKQWAAPIRAGERLRPKAWPNGAKVAVLITFDVDNETWSLPDGIVNYGQLSDYQYGAKEGLPRVLKLLDERRLPATFFVPAAADILTPDTLPSILKSGRHEVAMHGWVHEDVRKLNNAAEEERLARQAFDYIRQKTGKAPVGIRTGSWEVSPHTVEIAKKLGLLYDSSMMAMDEPYRLLSNGQDSGVIELPITWLLDDAPFLPEFGTLPSPELVFRTFQDEFDEAYREGTVYHLTLHPQVVGRRSRMIYLRKLLDHIQAKSGVWFTTAEELARYVKANGVPQP